MAAMRTTLGCASCALAVLAAACTRKAYDPVHAEQELKTQSMMFSRLGHYAYAFTWEKRCFCDLDTIRPMRVTVEEAKIMGAVFVADQRPVGQPTLDTLTTVTGVFDLIQSAIDADADGLTVTYDPVIHYPASVKVDYESTASDDGFTLALSDFQGAVSVP